MAAEAQNHDRRSAGARNWNKEIEETKEKPEDQMKKATIIMPVYNGQSFLRQSVRDVFRQTYDNVELIAIDDGSKDGSLKLLRRLAQKAPDNIEMRVFTQENAGICSTRNRGLDLASGSYIFFMDQDDRMKRDCVEALISSLEEEEADMAIGGHLLIDENGRTLERWRYDTRTPWHKYRNSAPWGRVFRREIIEQNHLRFMQTLISEDFYFNVVYMSFCKKIHITPYVGYGWTYRAASESHHNMSRFALDRNPLPMLTGTLEDMRKPNILEPDLLEYMFIKHIVWYLLFTAKGTPGEVLRQMCSACFDWLRQNFPDYDRNPNLSLLRPRGESAKVRSIVRTAVTLQRAGLFLPFLTVYSKT